MENMDPTAESTILDIGVTSDIERIESNFFEKLYPYKHKITAASLDDATHLQNTYKDLKFIKLQDGESLPFLDNEFDIAFSNAVVEHVGSKEKQQRFINEIIRVSRKCFISVPNRLFPVEHHTALPFIHYLPKNIHRKILKLLNKGFYASEERLNLLTKGDFKALFPNNVYVKCFSVRLFFIPSNIIAVVSGEKD